MKVSHYTDEDLATKLAEANKEYSKIDRKRSALIKETLKRRDNASKDRCKLLDFDNLSDEDMKWLLEAGHHVRTPQYQASQQYISKLGLYTNGFQPDTNQVKLCFTQYGDLDKVLKGLEFVLPYLDIAKSGYLEVDTHSKEEYTTYRIDIDKKILHARVVEKHGYREDTIVEEWGSINDIFEKFRKYYQSVD